MLDLTLKELELINGLIIDEYNKCNRVSAHDQDIWAELKNELDILNGKIEKEMGML